MKFSSSFVRMLSRASVAVLAIGIAGLLGVAQSKGAFAAPSAQGVMAGAQVFQQNCSVCHGINAQGRLGPPLLPLPPEIAEAPRDAIVEELTQLVRSGIPGAMPRFTPNQVSDADVESLVDWFLATNELVPEGSSFYEALAPVEPVEDSAFVRYFPQTGHTISYAFKAYWERHGGAERFGYPLTEEFVGFSPLDGQPYTMQVFENAQLVYYPDLAGTPDEVSLLPLGSIEVDLRTHFLFVGGGPGGGPGGEDEGPGGQENGTSGP